MQKKMGRPKSENPKNVSLNLRIDGECEKILQEYCKKENIHKSEAIRRAILKLVSR